MSQPRVRPRRLAERRRSVRRPLLVELLESRQLLTTFTVNTTADDGPGLDSRWAITQANANPNPSASFNDEIDFNIPGGSIQTITLHSPLPPIKDPLNIDATTQPGFVPNKTNVGDEQETDVEVPMVQIDGSAIDAAAFPNANGLEIDTINCSVQGLSITGFRGAGLVLNPGPNVNTGAIGDLIESNFIGVASFNSIGNDLSTWVHPATNPTANGEGIVITSSNNRIGGTLPPSRNVIQGNKDAGVVISGPQGTGNLIEGDYILDNGTAGVWITSANNFIGEAIGAGPAGGGDIISGNDQVGVLISGPAATGNIVVNNEIGTNVGIAGIILRHPRPESPAQHPRRHPDPGRAREHYRRDPREFP